MAALAQSVRQPPRHLADADADFLPSPPFASGKPRGFRGRTTLSGNHPGGFPPGFHADAATLNITKTHP